MMNQVYKTLPDDRPIKSIIVVEDVDKCPKGYVPISKTYDQDSDADLWKESGFFGKKCTRYLCLSKTEGINDYVIQALIIINEKEMPPPGYKTLPKTYDSEVKSWRKKQLCYKSGYFSISQSAITDIIVLGRMKKAPNEFLPLGEINGMFLCYKMSKSINENSSKVPYPISPFHHEDSKTNSDKPSVHNYENLPSGSVRGNFGNEIQGNGTDILRPLRPAPKPPASFYATISGYNGLEGVPFILNPKFSFARNSTKDFPAPKFKTKSQIEEEYSYEFRTERET